MTMLEIIAFTAFIFSSTMMCLKQVHMFQLNSYNIPFHMKWMAQHVIKYWALYLSFAISIILYMNKMGYFSPYYILAFFVFSLTGFSSQIKKRIVYTRRVLCLLLMVAILFLGSLFLLNHLFPLHFWANSFIIYAFIPLLIMFGNVLNFPLEHAIRSMYIKSAMEKLRRHRDLKVIGITGSYGKTSLKNYLSELLRIKYSVLMTPESFNTPMGITRSIRELLGATHEVFVCEMGAKRRGEIAELCAMVAPLYGVVTSVGPQHLETFGSIENVRKTKTELLEAIPVTGTSFVNGDSIRVDKNAYKCKLITYGLEAHNDYYAKNIKLSPEGSEFTLVFDNHEFDSFSTKLIGEHNIVNLLGAIAVGHALDLSIESIRIQVMKILPAPHRLNLIQSGDSVIIDDSYNSNPVGANAALRVLSLFDGCKILITPGMVELGKDQKSYNFEFGKAASSVCDFIFLVGKNQTEDINKGLLAAGFDEGNLCVVNDVLKAIKMAKEIQCNKQRFILLENDLPDNYL